MKIKLLTLLMILSAIFASGCYDDSNNATVRINLGNMPIAKVEKKSIIDRFLLIFAKEAVAQTGPGDFGVTTVHLGAFDSNNQLLAKKSINVGDYPENNIVEFDVPARSGVTIVVLGEGEVEDPLSGYMIQIISHYGKSISLNITAGAGEEVPIEMSLLDDASINLLSNYPDPIKWVKMPGASLYKIYVPNYVTSGYDEIYRTGSDSFEPKNTGEYYLRIEFQFVGKDSNYLYFQFGA